MNRMGLKKQKVKKRSSQMKQKTVTGRTVLIMVAKNTLMYDKQQKERFNIKPLK